MTEREKAARGLLYDANQEELAKERVACSDRCRRYNNLEAGETDAREALIREIVGEIGQGFRIEQPFYCDYGTNIRIGAHFYANYHLVILDAAPVSIGDRVLIGPDCGIYTAGHPLDAELRGRGLEFARPVSIGNDVWIGGGVKILPGVSIGDGAVIGAGSVVTRDVPPGVVAAGNPCRVLHKIGEET